MRELRSKSSQTYPGPPFSVRAQLRPLLEKIRLSGGSYRWGYPISLAVKKGSYFSLPNPSDLPAMFSFLGVERCEVPDWLQPISKRRNSRTGSGILSASADGQQESGVEAQTGDCESQGIIVLIIMTSTLDLTFFFGQFDFAPPQGSGLFSFISFFFPGEAYGGIVCLV